MDSLLASALTSGSLEVQNGSQCGEGSRPDNKVFLDRKDKTLLSTKPCSLLSCPVKAAGTIRQDAQSINGEKPEVGGTSKPASQETSKIGGFRQPITVKTGVPVLRRQPIRIKIVVPPRCKRPITNSAISLTKDCARSHFRGPVLVSAGAVIKDKNRNKSKIFLSPVKDEEQIIEYTCEKTEEEEEAESFQETEAEMGKPVSKEKDVLDVKIVHVDRLETGFISSTNAVQVLSYQGIKQEYTARETEQDIPLILQEINLKSFRPLNEVKMEEQTEPLDLSLPKKRESRERRCGRFLDDPCCESSLIMEVDEYEGDGDRDMVEEDDEDDTHAESLPSPSFFSTSALSSDDCDTENLLLIDDQGIPYTLSPEGLKVPQVHASTSEGPQSDQAPTAEVEEKGSSHLTAQADFPLSQSLDNALNAPDDDFYPSTADESSSQCTDETNAKEVFASSMTNSYPSAATESNSKPAQEAGPVFSSSSGMSLPTQAIHILTNPSANAPILFLSSSTSSQLSTAPVGLSLPLSVTQTSPGASTPMFLLLSSLPSSPSDSTSAPIAVLDPSTGQLSQITTASAPVSLPLSSGQVSTLGSPLPVLSHPVIRLSSSNPPVILSGVNNGSSGPVLTSGAVPSSALALRDNHPGTAALIQTQIGYSVTNPGSEAISAEEASSENNKPSAFAASCPQTQSAACKASAQPTSDAEAQSPASDSNLGSSGLHSEHLPLDDHLYFSNMAAPPSPPIGPILPSGKLDSLDPLDPLDPLSPVESPGTLGSRRVLCCQLCPRIFFYLSDLERHAITHSQKKPHVCQQCGKAFKRSSHLQRHKHIHTGQRNFVCPICAKRFREAGELQRHQRVHTGEKPYQCQLCHTRFAERNTLRRHTKRKHPYHQVAMEMLNERRDRGGGPRDGGDAGSAGVQGEEESAEWYSSTVSTLENSESEMET